MIEQVGKVPRVGFASTAWTRVGQAGEASEHQAMAWDWLFKSYWYPLFAFLQREGHSASDAEEMLQQFFAWLSEKNILQRAQRDRGRFRNFLLVSLKQFVQRERRKERRQLWSRFRPLPAANVTPESQRPLDRPASNDLTPEAAYERAWALELLRAAMDALDREFKRAGDATRFAILKGFLTYDSEANYATASQELKVSEGAVRVAVHRLRQRFGELLRAQIAPTVSCDAEIDEEIVDLHRALGTR